MAEEEVLRSIEERLARLEAVVSGGVAARPPFPIGTPPGVIVDPAPWPRPIVDVAPWPRPIADPAPWPRPIVDVAPWPRPIADPAPWGRPIVDFVPTFGQASMAARAIPPVNPVVDPVPWGGGGGWGWPRSYPYPQPYPYPWPQPWPSPVADPAPPDIGRMTAPQLETSLNSINAEKIRLESLETMLRQQLDQLNESSQ